MEPFEDDKLVAALESLRPTPRPDFAAELDQRAAAGFPRRSPLGQLSDRLRAIGPRRVLIPAGATALAAIAGVTVVVAIGGSEEISDLSGGARFSHTEGDAPAATAAPSMTTESAAAGSSGPYAAQTSQREIERSARMTLGTDPENVRKASSEVFTTVHAYRGIVLNSSVRDGAAGDAGARFALLIPSAKLGDALADFSAIAEVRARHEATADITAPTVRSGEQLRDSVAKIEGLRAQLAAADTEAERGVAEAQLLRERRRVALLRSQLATLERRANLSRVSLQIETGEAGTSADEGGGWGVGSALDDAGEILAIAAGVTILALAILGPVALIALLAWLGYRAHVRRGRRRALA